MDAAEAQPVLEATYRLLADVDHTRQDAVCEALDRPPGDPHTIHALEHLYENGYITGTTIEESLAPIHIQATEKGLRKASGR